MEAASSEMVHSSLSRYFFREARSLTEELSSVSWLSSSRTVTMPSGVEEALVAPTLVLSATALV
jgi:hypothetical protein